MSRNGDKVGSLSRIVRLNTGGRVGNGLGDHFSCKQHGLVKTKESRKSVEPSSEIKEETYQQE